MADTENEKPSGDSNPTTESNAGQNGASPPPPPPPPPPAPATGASNDDVMRAVSGLTETVSGLVETVSGLVAAAGKPADTTPIKRPWTHAGSRRS